MIAQLTARDFRNLSPLAWRIEPGTHLLLGDNGAGKTSLLEAVYVLATTRSFRTAQLADCPRHGTGRFYLSGEVESGTGVRAELAVTWGEEGRGRAVNGREGSLAEHLEVLPVVAWAAADAEVVTGPPALRRKLMDRGVLGLLPRALSAFGRYRRALGEKRQLLFSGGKALASWNAVLAEAAAEVIARRRAYVERLEAALAATLEASGLAFPPVELVYRPSPAEGLEGAAALAASLARLAGRERERRQPLAGPHRDDLEVRWGGRPVREVASAGERKALSLSLAAAHGRVLAAAGRQPVYLLDDLDAELAPNTLAAVWKAVEPGGQILATSNRPAVWEGLPAAFRWWVEGGEIEAL